MLKTSIYLLFETFLVICNSDSLSLCASDTDFLFCCCCFMQLVIVLLSFCLFAFWWSSWLFFFWCWLLIFFMSHFWSIDLLLRFQWCLCNSILTVCIQLKIRHDYFKSYLHQLSENNSNKCYEICKMRQMSKHLLLNCKHYRAEQLQLKAKAQFKNMNTILMLFIIKIERIAMLKYLKSTWIATRKWLLRMKK